jgi:hypothetical protein
MTVVSVLAHALFLVRHSNLLSACALRAGDALNMATVKRALSGVDVAIQSLGVCEYTL